MCAHLKDMVEGLSLLKTQKTLSNRVCINNAKAFLSEASSLAFHSTSAEVGRAAQLEVQRAAQQLCSVDTVESVFQNCNSIISPGSCSTTREERGAKVGSIH